MPFLEIIIYLLILLIAILIGIALVINDDKTANKIFKCAMIVYIAVIIILFFLT